MKHKPEYILIQWPESQMLPEYPHFEEYCYLADSEKFGPMAFFVSVVWLELYEKGEV